MNHLKKIFTVALLAVGSLAAYAQDATEAGKDYKPFPHMFVGVQGGAQTTFTNYDQLKLITPTASVYFGGWFTPVVGARLHVNGIWNKGGYDGGIVPDFKYNYKYITPNLDLMLNLVTLFGKKDYYPVNAYLLGGIGLNYAWDNDDAYAQKTVLPMAWKDNRLSHNARVGAMLDVNLAKHWSVNLEVAANSLSDRYNSKTCDKDDWSLTAQLGLTYKFGFKKKAKPAPEPEPEPVVEPEPEPEPEPVYATRIDTIWYDDVTYKDVTADRAIKKEIFFGLKEDGVNQDQAQIAAVAEFLKGVKDGEITIISYADKGTGNPKSNMNYSKKRAESTKRALIQKGVDPKMIKSVEWKGDTVQPYPDDNDKNRLSVITGHGVYTDKEKVVTKKFRTKEVRYQVK
ncbi:MAG: OmpA family protein [Bacteroidaceae bacterium]|nr:OmpA family protein [Bacteroidaceae bacterium]